MVVDSRAFRTITVGCRRCCSVDRGRVARVSVRSMRCRRCGCDRGSVDRGRPLLCGIRRRALWFGRRGIALISRFVQLSSPTRTGERPLTSGKCPHLRSDPRDARDWEDAMSEYKLRADCKGHEDDVRGAFRRLTEPAPRRTRASLMGSQPPRKDLFRARPLIHRGTNETLTSTPRLPQHPE